MLDIHSGIINIFSLSTWGKLMVWVTLIELDNKNKCFYNYYSKAREGWKDVQCREIHRPRQITWASLISRVCLWMGYDISGAPKKRKHTQQLKVVVTSLVPLPFLNPAWTSASSWFMYCWSLAWRNLSITLLASEMSANCAVVWAFFGIAFLWDWFENWPFPVLWPLLSFPDLLAYWVQHFRSITF